MGRLVSKSSYNVSESLLLPFGRTSFRAFLYDEFLTSDARAQAWVGLGSATPLNALTNPNGSLVVCRQKPFANRKMSGLVRQHSKQNSKAITGV